MVVRPLVPPGDGVGRVPPAELSSSRAAAGEEGKQVAPGCLCGIPHPRRERRWEGAQPPPQTDSPQCPSPGFTPCPSPSLFAPREVTVTRPLPRSVSAVRIRQSRPGAAGDPELRPGGLGGHQVSAAPGALRETPARSLCPGAASPRGKMRPPPPLFAPLRPWPAPHRVPPGAPRQQESLPVRIVAPFPRRDPPARALSAAAAAGSHAPEQGGRERRQPQQPGGHGSGPRGERQLPARWRFLGSIAQVRGKEGARSVPQTQQPPEWADPSSVARGNVANAPAASSADPRLSSRVRVQGLQRIPARSPIPPFTQRGC